MDQHILPLLEAAKGRRLQRVLSAALIAVSVAAGFPAAARAEIISARVAVRGMTCTICSSAVERRLRRVSCVQKASVDLERGLAQLNPRSGARFDGQRVLSAVRAAGFTPGDIEVVAEGTVMLINDLTYIELGPNELALLRNAGDMPASARAGNRVRVEGRFSDPSGDPRAKVAITAQHVELAVAR